MARIILSGGSGFVGLPTLSKLLKANHKVLAVSRQSPTINHVNLDWVQTDLSDIDAVSAVCKKNIADILIHLAWQDIPDFALNPCQKNLIMSQNLITQAVEKSKVGRVIITGSCFEYNRRQGACKEDQISQPLDHFTWSKLALLAWTKMFAKSNNFELAWMRVFYAYGPGQRKQSLIPSLISSIKAGQTPKIITPNACNDFINIDDVASALEAAASTASIDGVYNIGSGEPVSIYEICRIVDRAVTGTTKTADSVLKNAAGSSGVNFWADTKRIHHALNWSARTPLFNGIHEICNT